MKASLLFPSQCTLGESPIWHEKRKSCFWADIEDGVLFEMKWATERVQIYDLKLCVSLILENQDDDLLLAVPDGIIRFNLKNENTEQLVNISDNRANMRCNDGACDAQGRIWIGVMDRQCKERSGALFMVDTDLKVHKMIDGLTIPNGLVWSLANERMYFIDSPSRLVKSYIFNKNTGQIYFEKNAITIPPEFGIPDGMALDEEGMLWIAMYGGFCVTRWNPQNGEMLRSITLPVPNVTNCCFVGDDLDQLLITTAREGLSSEELKAYPNSGNVYIIRDTGVKGIKNNLCKY